MDLKLKSIKDVPSRSQETDCFNADLWVGNKKVANIDNDGRGGCDNVWAYEGMRPLLAEVEAYCKGLPKVKTMFGDKEHVMDNDLELETSRMLYEWRNLKEFKKTILFKDKDGVEYKWGWKGWTVTKLLQQPKGIEAIKKRVKTIQDEGGTVLNTNLGHILN